MLKMQVNVLRLLTSNRSIAMRNMSLHCKKAFVNGLWVDSETRNTFEVINPANGKLVGCVPDMTANDAQKAIDAATEAFETWQETTAKERAKILYKWFELMNESSEEIAKILTAESGKPFKEAIGEINYGNSFVEWFSEEARRIHGEILCSSVKSRHLTLTKQPIGVVGLITPWNFPQAMITRKASAALAAGCTCVIRPAEDTPLTALAIIKLAERAGFPPGVINVVTSGRKHASEIGKLFCESPQVAGISFTGSTLVGKILYKQCAGGIKRLALELGGNAPFIVFNSADIDKAVQGGIASKFRNCGQTCVSANRFLVQANVYDEFVAKFTTAVKNTVVIGDGFDPKVNAGPLVNEAQLKKVSRIVKDAITKGAKVHAGGKQAEALGKLFYEPTVLTSIKPNMDIYKEEVFGPVAPIIKFDSEEEAVCIANDTPNGLAGYFYSNDMAQVFRVARLLQVGMVGANEGLISTCEAAFGGVKESGLGREGSSHGIDDFTYIKYTCIGNLV